ncbi:MAG: glycosyltransferase [Methylococcales bacterium]
MSLINNGALSSFIVSFKKLYGQLTVLILLVFLGLSHSEPGSFFFMTFYITSMFCAVLQWRIAPKKFELSHWVLLIVAAIVIRLYFLDYPIAKDAYRYIWEGRIQNAGFDPYQFNPNSIELAHLKNDLWLAINHKDWSAIYGPVAQLFFKMIASFSPTVFAFKTSFLLLDLATLGILALILDKKSMHPGPLVLYAMNPLVIVAFSGLGHLDSLVMFLVMAAYYFSIQKQWGYSAIGIGLAISSKFTAIIFLPFLLRKENWQWYSLAIISAVLPCLFFEASVQEMFSSLFRFGTEMHFNGSLHLVFYNLLGSSAAVTLSVFLFLLISGAIWLTQDSPFRGAFFCSFAFLLLSPTVHYWYLCMWIPFMVIVPSLPAIVWSLSSVFYFNVKWRSAHGLGYSDSTVDQLLQYVPVFISILIVLILKVNNKTNHKLQTALPSVSILIPVLNEANNAQKLMRQLHAQTIKADQIIVIDGDSTDNSFTMFEQLGAHVIEAPRKGRGNQLVAGLAETVSDAILILHADVIPDTRVVERVALALAADPELLGGALGATFESTRFKYKIIAFLNLVRVALTGITFGDQGQFFRRIVAVNNNCLRAIPLMEDIELGMRLQALGKTRLLDGGLTVSVRRWKTKNVCSNAMYIFYLLTCYLFLRRFCSDIEVDKFYDHYYSDTIT